MAGIPFIAPREQQGLGASPGRMPWMPSPAGNLGPGHPRGSHLRLEAILNTSPLLCGFVPPSPSSSCSALSMLSRSCSYWSSSLHSKGQNYPGKGAHPTMGAQQWWVLTEAGQALATVLFSSIFPVHWAGIPGWKSHERQQSQHQWLSTGT